MKKVLSLILIGLLCLMCACGNNQNDKVETIDKMIDVDYGSFREKYGAPLYACNYKSGPSYQFTEGGPWFSFEEATPLMGPDVYKPDNEGFIEPLDHIKCTMIQSTVSGWLGISADKLNTIEDIKKYSGINEFKSEYNYMQDSNTYVAKTDKCTITITEYMGVVNGDSYVTIQSN